MLTSSSAIADALVTMLSAASVFGANTVSKAGYQLLESAASAAGMVKFRQVDLQPETFGNVYTELWDFEVRCFVRDTGDPNLATNRVWTVTDKVLKCLRADFTLLGTVDDVKRITAHNTPEEVLTVNGATWLPIGFTIQAAVL